MGALGSRIPLRDPNSFATSPSLFTPWNEWATRHGEFSIHHETILQGGR